MALLGQMFYKFESQFLVLISGRFMNPFSVRMFLIVASVSGALFLSGCDLVDKVDGSLDKINDMSDNTKNMQEKMDQLPVLTKASCELYDALRQGDTLTSRRNAVVNLLNSRQMARKISESGKYFMAFEFQLWSDSCQDESNLKLDYLKDSAAREFLREAQEFVADGDLSPDPAAQADGDMYSTGNLKASFNALAATLHMLNPKQEYRSKKEEQFKSYTMLDLLQDGLAAKVDLQSGRISADELPLQLREVLLQEKYAVALLQARYNIAVAIVLDGISNINGGFFSQTKMFLSPWSVDMNKANIAQLIEFQSYVKGAIEVRDFLRMHGYQPQLNSKFKQVLRNMRFNPDQKRTKAQSREEDKLINMLQQYADER